MAVALVGAACSSDSDTTTGAGDEADGDSAETADFTNKDLGILVYIMAVEGNFRPAEGLEEAAKAAGWNPEIVDAQADPAKFVSGMQQFLREDKDAAALLWIPAEAVSAALEEAKEQGMLVGDLLSGPSDLEPWHDISYDVEEMAALNAEAIHELVGDEGTIFAVVDNNVTNPREMWAATKRILAEEHPGIEIVGEHQSNVQNLVQDAQTAVTTTLSQHPDIDAFWAISDAQGTPMLSALETADRTDVGLISSNGQKEIVDAIRDGRPVASVAIGFEQGAYQLVDSFLHQMADLPVPEENLTLPLQLITGDNVPPAGDRYEGEPGFRERFKERWAEKFGID